MDLSELRDKPVRTFRHCLWFREKTNLKVNLWKLYELLWMKIEEVLTTAWRSCELNDSFWQLISDWIKHFFFCFFDCDWMKKFLYEFCMQSILSKNLQSVSMKLIPGDDEGCNLWTYTCTWKIMDLNCRERYEDISDHRSYKHNLSSCKKLGLKKMVCWWEPYFIHHWRLFLWLTNSDKPVLGPHAEGRKQTPITLIKQ